MGEFEYVGVELDIFREAVNWKNYWASFVYKYMSGEILEVGAGIGENTLLLCNNTVKRWVCLEPDPKLCKRIHAGIKSSLPAKQCEILTGTLANLEPGQLFDTIIFIDVLEHIEDDRAEMKMAVGHLKKGGRIIVLSPAHQWLFTDFDASIGHYRRYNKKSLTCLTTEVLMLERLYYLDAVGLLASAANRLFLRQSMPTIKQIKFWDRIMVRCSRIVDPILFYKAGKSVLGIWRKTNQETVRE